MGERVALFATVIIFIPLLDNLDLEKIIGIKRYNLITNILLFIIILNIILYMNIYYSIYKHKKFKESVIKSAIKNKEETVLVYAYPLKLLWNSEPYAEYHVETFKNYYNIKENQKIKIVLDNFKFRSILNDFLNRYAVNR